MLQDGHSARLGALARRVLAAGRLDQYLSRHAPSLNGRYVAVTAEHDTPVGRLSAAIAGAVVDDEGLQPGGLHPDAEPGQPVVPGDPGLVGGLQRLDGAAGQGQLVQGEAFAGWSGHSADAVRVAGQPSVEAATAPPAALAFINLSILSAICCAGPRSCPMVQSAAYPSVTSPGRAWLTKRLVGARGSSRSRSATVMNALRKPWYQNFVPPAAPILS